MLVTCAAFAAATLAASCLLVTNGFPQAARPSAADDYASLLSSLPAASPAEGHSPLLEHQLAGPLSGTGLTGAGAGTLLSTATTQAEAAASSTWVNGIDVASIQHPDGAAITWTSVAAAGYKFAAIKATEGNYYVNPYYASDAADATAAGLYVSAYEFANPADSTGSVAAQYSAVNAGTAQSSTGANYQVGGNYLPLMLDIEYNPYSDVANGNECYGLTAEQMVIWIGQFVTETQALTGAQPIIYTPPSWWDLCTGNSTAFGRDVLWVPSYSADAPSTLPAGWDNWDLWQYTSVGSVSGITGDVDLDYFSGASNQQTFVNWPASLQVQTLNALAGQQVTYTATGLPPGLTMSTTGLISGTPTTVGSYQVTVTPSASSAVLPATVSFTWDVGPQPFEVLASQGTGYCLDNSGGLASDGNPIEVWACLYNSDQGWLYVPSVNGVAGDYQLENTNGMCLDDPGDSAVNGTKVQLWSCLGNANQTWTQVTVGNYTEFVNANGLCLDNTGNALTDGNPVQVWACLGDPAQQWYAPNESRYAIPPSYQVQASQQSGFCLDNTGGLAVDGNPVQVWQCQGDLNQGWTYAPSANGVVGDYQLQNSNNLCLDDPGDSTVNGTRVQLWSCLGDASQTWTQVTVGSYVEYVNANGLCLDNTGNALTDGNRVQVWACLGDPAQQWYGPSPQSGA
jgi:GH25 family lysozyme M1 (1,4-beta-N-acetylmuramidase)